MPLTPTSRVGSSGTCVLPGVQPGGFGNGEGHRRRRPSHAPRGLRHQSPGLRYPRYPGTAHGHGPNPNEGCVARIAKSPRVGTMAQPTLGLDGRNGVGTQGSGYAATLGWKTQSRWDREAARTRPLSRSVGGTQTRHDGRSPVLTRSMQLPDGTEEHSLARWSVKQLGRGAALPLPAGNPPPTRATLWHTETPKRASTAQARRRRRLSNPRPTRPISAKDEGSGTWYIMLSRPQVASPVLLAPNSI